MPGRFGDGPLGVALGEVASDHNLLPLVLEGLRHRTAGDGAGLVEGLLNLQLGTNGAVRGHVWICNVREGAVHMSEADIDLFAWPRCACSVFGTGSPFQPPILSSARNHNHYGLLLPSQASRSIGHLPIITCLPSFSHLPTRLQKRAHDEHLKSGPQNSTHVSPPRRPPFADTDVPTT